MLCDFNPAFLFLYIVNLFPMTDIPVCVCTCIILMNINVNYQVIIAEWFAIIHLHMLCTYLYVCLFKYEYSYIPLLPMCTIYS